MSANWPLSPSSPSSAVASMASGGPSPWLRGLVQSPLRAGLVRYLHAQPLVTFELDALMQAFGQLRIDVENCLQTLVASELVCSVAGPVPRYRAQRPADRHRAAALDAYLLSEHTDEFAADSPALRRFRELIGRDEKMLLVFESIRTAAKSDLPLLVLGPTGSGKELVARIVHEMSRRRQHPIQAINCAALPDSLFESELFGYEKGAFTGANTSKPGRVELADGGTLFLDEVGDLSLVAQAKLLRVVEDRRVEHLGGRRAIDVDFRLICATNRPVAVFVNEGRFREDLYYRINAFSIRLPALRERASDIPILARRFLSRYCAAHGLPVDAKDFSPEALDRMMGYPWPGNIRELESTVSRAALTSPGETIDVAHVHFLHATPAASQDESPVLLPLREVERAHIERVLQALGGNKKQAARALQISRETLYRKIAEYGRDVAQRSA